MVPFSFVPVSDLSFVEREEIAVLHARECGVREIDYDQSWADRRR